MAAPRPLLRRMLSFREPLLLLPCLLSVLGAAASALARSHASLLHSLARSLVRPAPAAVNDNMKHAAAHAPSSAAAAATRPDDGEDAVAALSKAEVEAVMAAIGLAASGRGEGLAAAVGRGDVAGLFDADEPSFAEVRGAFAVFDADRDGFIGAEDLRAALARRGGGQDAAAGRAMVVAAGGGRDARMSLFQFVAFLENGLC
jgi:calmodulin